MADPISAVALTATIAGSGLSAYSQVRSGQEQGRAALFEQQQLEQRQRDLQNVEQTTRAAAAQAEAERRDRLTSSIESIMSLRAGRGVGEASPTAMATFDALREDASGNIATEKLNYLTKAEQAKIGAASSGYGARIAGEKGQTSLLAGYLGAGATIASGIGSAYNIYRYPGTSRR